MAACVLRHRRQPRGRVRDVEPRAQRRRSGIPPLRARSSSWATSGWVEHHRILAVFLPAVLPPPIPLLPFALAAGALGVARRRFLVVYGSARTLRYSLIAWLGVVYGRHAIRMWSGTLQQWSTPLIFAFAGLLVAGTCFGIWKVSGLRKIDAADKLALHKAAARACKTPKVA